MKTVSTRFFFGLILCHFALMGIGMTKLDIPRDHWAAKAARLYAELTGAGAGFGFFSPNIPRQILVDFDVTRGDGRVIHTTLQQAAGSDVSLRLGNMIRMMTKAFKDKKVYRSLAASLAASVYKRYPDAKQITLHAAIYEFPTMRAYRQGQRAKRVEIYSAKFTRRS